MKTIKKITWKMGEPDTFPCTLCEKRATEIVRIDKYGINIMNIVLCAECSEKSETELWNRVLSLSRKV